MKTPAENRMLHSGDPRKLIVQIQQPSGATEAFHILLFILKIETNSFVTTATRKLRNMSL